SQLPYPGQLVGIFAYSSWNAWVLGRSDVARERIARMVATLNGDNPYYIAYSEMSEAMLRINLREFERAETLATQALGLSEQHQFPYWTAVSRCVLGRARAQLGRWTEGMALIRKGIAGLVDLGSLLAICNFTLCLAAAQECSGAIADALETVEQA